MSEMAENCPHCVKGANSEQGAIASALCRKRLYVQAALMSAIIIIADQISKWAVLEFIIRKGLVDADIMVRPEAAMGFFSWLMSAPERLPLYSLPVLPFFNITMVWNDGVSFGLLASEGDMGKYLLIVLALAISLFLGFLISRSESRFEALAMAAVIGGAIGNIIDRLRFGAVADFLDFHILGYHFPVFNIADSAISIGIAFLLIYSLFCSNEPTKESKDT